MQPDFFISHANEDKEKVARPLAIELKRRGFTVWFDEFELSVGDSLSERINDGLAKSRFGIVIFSQSFFKKRWPREELNGLMARSIATTQKIILPVWHGISKESILEHAPILADKLATSTAKGLGTVAGDIVRALETAAFPNFQRLTGQWLDPSDGDTVHFQQYGTNVLGIYDFSYKIPFGAYKGLFVKNILYYRWRWFEDSLCGAGRMELDKSNQTLCGQWWYDQSPDGLHSVQYKFVSDEYPNWLSPSDFKRLTMRDI